MNILLVDDDHNVLSGLKRLLRNEPYELYSATSARDALAIINSIEVEVVITDEKMPGLTGTQLLEILKEKYPKIVGIMLTGQPNVYRGVNSVIDGEIYRYFTKPCDPEELAQAIREAKREREFRGI